MDREKIIKEEIDHLMKLKATHVEEKKKIDANLKPYFFSRCHNFWDDCLYKYCYGEKKIWIDTTSVYKYQSWENVEISDAEYFSEWLEKTHPGYNQCVKISSDFPRKICVEFTI